MFVHQLGDALIFGMFASMLHMDRTWFSAMDKTTIRGASQSTLRQLMLAQEDKPMESAGEDECDPHPEVINLWRFEYALQRNISLAYLQKFGMRQSEDAHPDELCERDAGQYLKSGE